MGGVVHLENEIRFGFVSWDWKSSPDVEEVNEVLAFIGRHALVIDISAASDAYRWMFYSGELSITPRQAYELYRFSAGELPKSDRRVKKFGKKAQFWNPGVAMSRDDLEAFIYFNQPKTIKITNPIITKLRKGEPFVVTDETTERF